MSKYLLNLKRLGIMMRMTHKLALVTACLAIFSAVFVKPSSAIDNNLSGELIAQPFNTKPFTKGTTETSDSSQNNPPNSKENVSDDAWFIPLLCALGGYLIGSFVGTQKTYTKMNKSERKRPPFA